MPIEDFITWIYCWVDDTLPRIIGNNPLRKRGFLPALCDAEMITMEIVVEFLSLDADKHIWSYFSIHWKHLFPAIGSYSQFAKQPMNLWAIKQKLLDTMTQKSQQDKLHIVDGFPIPVSHFKRARGCKRFKGDANYGYCASKDETYFGFKGHIIVNYDGEISGLVITPANTSERETLCVNLPMSNYDLR